MNGVYGSDTVTVNYVRFWFRRFSSGIFGVVENVDKTVGERIEVARHFSCLKSTKS